MRVTSFTARDYAAAIGQCRIWRIPSACLPVDESGLVTRDSGMTRDTLRDIDNRRPFRPYSLRLNNGDMVRVEKAEHCLVTEDGRTLVFNEREGNLKFITVANITTIEQRNSVSPKQNKAFSDERPHTSATIQADSPDARAIEDSSSRAR